jgi:hypothetical protein
MHRRELCHVVHLRTPQRRVTQLDVGESLGLRLGLLTGRATQS